jgi:hypothetical protein
MEISNLSLTPTTAQDPDQDLVWLTQWFVPSPTDPEGGKNYHVYAEAFSDSGTTPTLQCYLGESRNLLVSGGATITYPGNDPALPASNCQMTPGPNGSISIYVPLSMVTVPGAIDNRLHEVTASTMTLAARANNNPDPFNIGLGGVAFNLIDAAQGYIFEPAELQIVSISRLPNGSIVLDCRGVPNRLNTVQVSDDLVSGFRFLASVPADANGLFQFIDTDAANFTKRFYRLTLP